MDGENREKDMKRFKDNEDRFNGNWWEMVGKE